MLKGTELNGKINTKWIKVLCYQTSSQCKINARHLVASLCGVKILRRLPQFKIHKAQIAAQTHTYLQCLKKF